MRTVVVAALLSMSVSAFGGTSVWTSGGPNGGTIWDIAIDPATPAIVYASTEGGLFKSVNGGGSWAAVTSAPTGDIVTAIEIDPILPSTIYIATNRRGVWKTTNSGTSWAEVSAGLPTGGFAAVYAPVYSLAIDPNNTLILYAGTKFNGVYKTTNGGGMWVHVSSGLPAVIPVFALAVDPASSSTVYAGLQRFGYSGSDGVYKSTNSGSSWSAANTGLTSTSNGYQIWDLEIDTSTTPSTVYVGADGTGVARSTNGGASWTQISTGLDGVLTFTAAYAVEVAATAPSTIYAGTRTRVVKSTDGGATWTSQMATLTGNYFGALAVDPTTALKAYTGNNSNLFNTTNGGTAWAASSTGLNGLTMECLTYDASLGLLAGSRDGVYRSTNQGTSWVRLGDALLGYIVFDISVQGGTINALLAPAGCRRGDRGGFFTRSTDGGTIWSPLVNLVLAESAASMAVHPANPDLVYVTSEDPARAILKSVNGGTTWTNITGTASVSSEAPVVVDPANTSIVYVGSGFGNGIYKSIDGGTTWTLKDAGPPIWYPVTTLAIDPNNANHIFAGSLVFLYESLDGGETWSFSAPLDLESPGSPYEELNARSIVFDPANSSTLYMATANYGVFRSTDSGVSWSEYNNGLFDLHLSELVAGAAGYLHAATAGSGVFDFNQSTGAPSGPPPVLTATASLASGTWTANLTWTAHGTATSYTVERSVNNAIWGSQGVVSGQAYSQTVSAGTTYLYRVRAAGATANSNIDHATTYAFTDDPLAAGMTVRVVHLTDLRTAVISVRGAASLGSMKWTDDNPRGVTVRAVHITELRSALSAALSAIGKSLTVTDVSLTGLPISAVHFQELRNATK